MSSFPDPLALVGTTVDRRFEVTRLAATGGQAYLYRALDHHDGREVALKVFRAAAGAESAYPALRRRVFAEATMLGSLRHPNLVPFVAVGTLTHGDLELPFLATRWIDGESLADALDARIGRGGRSPVEALALLDGALSALAYLHASGVVHGDIKPSNIHLTRTPDGRLTTILLDLGIARSARAQAARPMTLWMFSPDYAPPEAVRNEPLTAASDVFSMAVVFTEVLTDQRVNEGDNPHACCARVLAGELPTPAAFGKDVGAIDDVLRVALARDSTRRFASAGALRCAVESAVHGRAFDGRAQADTVVSPPTEARRSSGSRRIALAAILVAAACGALAAAVATPRRVQEAAQTEDDPLAAEVRDARQAAQAAAERLAGSTAAP